MRLCGCEQQREGERRGGIIQHAGRVGEDHIALGRGLQVEIIVADRVIRHNSALRPGGIENAAVDFIRQQGDDRIPPTDMLL